MYENNFTLTAYPEESGSFDPYENITGAKLTANALTLSNGQKCKNHDVLVTEVQNQSVLNYSLRRKLNRYNILTFNGKLGNVIFSMSVFSPSFTVHSQGKHKGNNY